MFCEIRYIYSLNINNKPIYIGQTKDVKKRYGRHKSDFNRKVNKKIYNVLNKYIDNFDLVKIKILKVCSVYEVNIYEMKYIKYCLDRNVKLLNNCVKTNSYRIK
jgi:predicted GIY-YIG superfamily endonuclease